MHVSFSSSSLALLRSFNGFRVDSCEEGGGGGVDRREGKKALQSLQSPFLLM